MCVCVCVREVKVSLWALFDREPQCKKWHPVESLPFTPHIMLLIYISIHTHTEMCHLSPSTLLFPASSSMLGIDFWLNVHISLCPALWHLLISLIPIWYQITDPVRRLPTPACYKEVALHLRPLWQQLPLCVIQAFPLCIFFLYIPCSVHIVCFYFMWITSQHSTAELISLTNTQLIFGFVFKMHFWVICGIVCCLLLKKTWNSLLSATVMSLNILYKNNY